MRAATSHHKIFVMKTMTEVTSPPGSQLAGGRFEGIDFARLLAILGMMCAHVWPGQSGQLLDIRGWSSGNPSTLFAVLGGVSIVLASRRFLEQHQYGAAARSIAGRGCFVVVVGLTLGLLTTPATDVLVYFGVAILCTIPFLRAPSWVLVATAVVLALGTGLINGLVRLSLPNPSEYGSISWADLRHPLSLLRGVFLTGTYPAATWLVYLLVGMLLARALTAARAQGTVRLFAARIAGAGLAFTVFAIATAQLVYVTIGRSTIVANNPILLRLPPGLSIDDVVRIEGFGAPDFALGWPTLLLDTPHTGTVLDILRGVGVAMVVIGAMLGVATLLTPAAARILRPLRATGGAPLSVYVLHLTTLAVAAKIGKGEHVQTLPWFQVGPGAFIISVVVALAFGAALAVLGRRGPLEWAASSVAMRFGAMATPRHPISGTRDTHSDPAHPDSLRESDPDFSSTHHVKENL